VAKQTSKALAKKFLTELATDPEKLASFINDPEGAMEARRIPKEDRAFIRNVVALEVAKKLVVIPEAFHVHF
jgi:hypothetical protein